MFLQTSRWIILHTSSESEVHSANNGIFIPSETDRSCSSTYTFFTFYNFFFSEIKQSICHRPSSVHPLHPSVVLHLCSSRVSSSTFSGSNSLFSAVFTSAHWPDVLCRRWRPAGFLRNPGRGRRGRQRGLGRGARDGEAGL